MKAYDIVERLRSLEATYDDLIEAADEIDRLQAIIDSRPAINAGLPQTYINWSQAIYASDMKRAMESSGITISHQ